MVLNLVWPFWLFPAPLSGHAQLCPFSRPHTMPASQSNVLFLFFWCFSSKIFVVLKLMSKKGGGGGEKEKFLNFQTAAARFFFGCHFSFFEVGTVITLYKSRVQQSDSSD